MMSCCQKCTRKWITN